MACNECSGFFGGWGGGGVDCLSGLVVNLAVVLYSLNV